MDVSLAILRELHNLHQQMAELQRRQDRGPKQIAAHEANVARLETALQEAQHKSKQARVSVDQKQLDLKSGETKISDWRTKLNRCESNKEYQTLLEQIAAGVFSPDDPHRYSGLVDALRGSDWFMVTADFTAYWQAQERVEAAWRQRDAWLRSAVLNTAHMGWFSSDRTIRSYAREIWNAEPEF